MAFGLTSQLAAWAQSNAPLQAPLLTDLLAAQRTQIAQSGRLDTLQSDLASLSTPSSDVYETMLDSAPDEPTKASLRFDYACFRIQTGDLEGARKLLAELEDETRQLLLDLIDLKDVIGTIATGDLEAARLGHSELRDELYLALAALHLAAARWNRSEKTGDESDRRSALPPTRFNSRAEQQHAWPSICVPTCDWQSHMHWRSSTGSKTPCRL